MNYFLHVCIIINLNTLDAVQKMFPLVYVIQATQSEIGYAKIHVMSALQIYDWIHSAGLDLHVRSYGEPVFSVSLRLTSALIVLPCII